MFSGTISLRRAWFAAIWTGVAQVAACHHGRGSADATDTPANSARLLTPDHAEWLRAAPPVSHLRFETTRGAFVLELVREWGHRGADRLYNLARLGYYNNTRFHRVRAGYIAQFGLHGDSGVNAAWSGRYLADDPPRSQNRRGAFAFAYEGPGRPNTRNTQIYINLADNPRNDVEPFTILGTVIEGMNVVDQLYSGYGEESGGGVRQGKQGPLARGGNAYMDRAYPRLDRILRVRVAEVQSSRPLSDAVERLGRSASVLQLDPQDTYGGPLAVDRGIAGLRQRLLELRTTASVMQTTAHPDDEQSGLLTLLSRGTGARTALLTLNRGEAGANAIGSELFDALGLLRTEELLLAGRYYGIDDQYFTSATDYGFSKTVTEAARSWDTTAVLRDMVRIIRQNQPLVVVARWYGDVRDGHGHHQFAGAITPLAVAAAADPTRFPELLSAEGLQPWRVLRVFRANLRAEDRADVVLDAGAHDPWLGMSYQALGTEGLSRQRSQAAGRRPFGGGPAPQRLQFVGGAPATSSDDLFSGIDTSLPALLALTGEREPPGLSDAMREADNASRRALESLIPDAPWKVAPLLVTTLRAIRSAQAIVDGRAPHAEHVLAIKERQCERAIVAALALDVSAIAGAGGGDGHPVVPGERVAVQVAVSHAHPGAVTLESVALTAPADWPASPRLTPQAPLVAGQPWRAEIDVTVPPSAEPTRPPFHREGIAQNHYTWRAGVPDHSPRAAEPLGVQASLTIEGERVTVERVVRFRRIGSPPDGVSFPRLVVVPPVSLRLLSAVRVVRDAGAVRETVTVQVTGLSPTPVSATVGLAFTADASASSAQDVRVSLGEQRTVAFSITMPPHVDSLAVSAFARVGAREWRDEVSVIAHRELEPAYLYAAAIARIRRVPVSVAPALSVGYIMGTGDLVPDAILQLGATVTLLDAATVTAGDFSRYDAVVIGTRAYAVRPELPAATASLVSYMKQGGNVVVLYQTQVFRPETMAPFPASLPNDAEEVTEEDAPVRLLAPSHALLTSPNRITERDFDGWIEQRGSKFLTQLSPEYTALVETHDRGQPPQAGIWVTARVGAGQWSYVALALHRQVPYAVPGALHFGQPTVTPIAQLTSRDQLLAIR